MKCNGCFKVIENSESFFSGHWVPESCEKDGSRKFGCSPHQNYCKVCMENMPTFFNQPERSKREDFDKIVKKAIDKAYEPDGIYDKCITHYQNADIDVLFKDAVL